MTSNKTTCSPMRNGSATVDKTLFNTITSTPLSSPRSRLSNSLLSPSRITPLRTPPRYSLSETSNRLEIVPKKTSSPLLRSSKYNSNLTAYMDGRSPGLHSRIVQYSNEARNSPPVTHQAKYGSPGLFPVVHFFKKEMPVISPKPKRVMIRLASPDIHWYNTTTLNKRNLNDSADTRNGHHNPQISTETETRSVLDALREISRKRIHADSDFEGTLDASCKRQKCTDSDIAVHETNKRAREDSPKSDSSGPTTPSLQQPKKICVVDVLAASFTSSQLLKEKMQNALKRKSEVEIEKSIEQAGVKRQPTLSNAETQTINIESKAILKKSPETPAVSAVSDKITEESNGEGNKDKQDEMTERYSNIFDEKKLEVQRKNKLAILLSAITGEKPNLLSYAESAEEETNKTTSGESKLVSILSPLNKTKHDKHVHFNLTPEIKSIDNTTPVSTEVTAVKEKDEISKDNILNVSEASKNVSQSKPELNVNFGSIMQTSSATLSTTTTTTSILSTPIVTTMLTTVKNSEQSDINPISNLSFPLGKPPTSSDVETPKKAVVTSALVSGGFKFKLSPSNTNVSTPPSTNLSTAPSFNFGGVPNSTVGSTSTAIISSANNYLNTTPKKIPQSFGTGTINFSADKSQTNLSMFGVNATTVATIPPPSAFGLATPSMSLVVNKDLMTIPSVTSFGGFGTSTISSSTQSLTTQPTFAFGGNPAVAFGTPVTTTSPFGPNANLAFGIPTTSGATFGTATSIPTFGTTNNLVSTTATAAGFGVATNSSAFGNSAPTGFGSATCDPAKYGTNTFGLGTTTPTLNTTMSGMSTPTTTAAFRIPTCAGGTFGMNTAIPAFGTTTSSSIFGPNPSASVFTSETPTGFGILTTSSGFGITTTSPGFGTANSSKFGTVNTSASGFGAPSPSFAIAPTSVTAVPKPSGPTFNFCSGNNFGSSGLGGNAFAAPATSAPAFGSTTTPSAAAFGSTTMPSAPAFGNTTTPSAPGFGSTTTPGFGGFGAPSVTSSRFGTSTTNSVAFGGTATSKFGASGFGGPNVTATTTGFGTTNAFEATTTASATFGNSGAFGTVSQPNAAFGNNNAFASKTTAPSVFGTSTFGATTTASSGFGTNTTGFGNQSITGFFGKNTTSGFTATTTAAPTFAANNKPFAFGANTANNAGFSNAPAFNFATSTTPGFGETKQTGFAQTFPSNGFGSSSLTTATTTTNNTASIFGSSGFGNTSGIGTSSFGGNNNSNNNPAPPFGSNTTNNPAPPFGSNTTNAFGPPNNSNTFGTPSNTNSTFGSSAVTPNFGFGNGDAPSTFNKPQAPTGFGSASGDSTFQFGSGNNTSTPAFGTANPTNNTGQVFSFGTSNPAMPSSTDVFAFGTPEQKSNFPGNNNVSGFGTGTPTFGSNNVSGTFGTPQFSTPTAGMFSIGSGSSTGPRQRHQLKAKRRT